MRRPADSSDPPGKRSTKATDAATTTTTYNTPSGATTTVTDQTNAITYPSPGVASTAIGGAADYEGVGALKQVLMYEQIGASDAQRNLFLGKLRALPAAVLVWESSSSPEKVGPNKTKMLEQWTLHIVVSRLDAGELRSLEGLEILDLCSELLGRAVGIDRADFTNGDLSLLGRNRIVAADSAYIYGLRFQTSTTITKREQRVFEAWLKTSYTLVTTPETALSPSRVTLVEDAVYDQVVPEEP